MRGREISVLVVVVGGGGCGKTDSSPVGMGQIETWKIRWVPLGSSCTMARPKKIPGTRYRKQI